MQAAKCALQAPAISPYRAAVEHGGVVQRQCVVFHEPGMQLGHGHGVAALHHVLRMAGAAAGEREQQQL